MKAKTIISALLLAAGAAAWAQTPADSAEIIPPSSFDTDWHELQNNWLMRRYAVMDSAARTARQKPASDEVYIERLQKLQTIMPMQYNDVVRGFIELYALKKPQLVENMLGMSLFYMPIFEDALERHGMPLELKYLPVIESALNPNAVSRAGAAGLWQFMPSTGKDLGLEVNSLVDERRDPWTSTEAACVYLKTLYNMYNDWNLAIAAYNCGPGNVNKAINRAGGKIGEDNDYWQIYYYLPSETRGYVPAFIAANYVMNYYGEHGIKPALARMPMVVDTVHVTNRVHFDQISTVLGIPVDELRALNPQYRKDVIPGNAKEYVLTLPAMQAYCYQVNEPIIINFNSDTYNTAPTVTPGQSSAVVEKEDNIGKYREESTTVYHKVKRGETLKSIAGQYGVTAQSIRSANNLSSSRVRTGKTLKIVIVKKVYLDPEAAAAAQADSTAVMADSTAVAATEPVVEETPAPAPAPTQNTNANNNNRRNNSSASTPKYTNYTVKSGDTLGKIAKKHNTTVAAIKKANGLRSDMIRPGQKLKIPKK